MYYLIGLGIFSMGLGLGLVKYYFTNSNEHHKKFITDPDHIPQIIINDLKIVGQESKISLDILKEYYKFKLEHVLLGHNIDYKDYLSTQENNKIYIDYTLNNDNYKICINGLLSLKHPEHDRHTILRRLVMSAEIISENSIIDVSKEIIKYQGPHRNFYNNLDGPSNNIRDLLIDYKDLIDFNNKSSKLKIYDLFGHEHEFALNDNIVWTSTY